MESWLICTLVWGGMVFVSDSASIAGVKKKRSFRVQQWLNELEEDGYDHATPPAWLEGKTTEVKAELFVESLGNFQPISMDYDTDIYFAQEWIDPRLIHNQSDRIAFNSEDLLHRIWVPDVYFANSKQARYNHVTVPNLIVWIWPDGSIRINVRINIRVSCHMNLRAYPLDTQECALKVLPYGNNMTKLNLTWLSDDPIQINKDIQDADLELVHKEHQYCTNDSVYYNSTYSCLRAVFYLRRTIGQSLLQVYAPTVSIVIISWISFWIDPSSVPGRTGLCVTTLLTLSTQAAGISFRLPPVGYAKALDVWLSVCLLFLFGSLIEFTVVNMYTRRWQSQCLSNSTNGDAAPPKMFQTVANTEMMALTGECYAERFRMTAASKFRAKALYIDKVSRVLFPTMFALFMLVYWIIYTIPRQEVPVTLVS